MEQLIQFLKNQFREGFFNSKLLNTKDISDPIVRAINDTPTTLTVGNPEDISSSIVDAQDKTTKAIESLVLPTTDLTELIEKIGELKSAINDKDLSVSVGDTKIDVDTKGIISALKRLQQSVEDSKTTIEPQEVIDYTSYLDEIITNINKPGYDFSGIEKILERISAREFILPLDEKGNVKVSFEGKPFGSSGSRALSSAQETVLRGIATEETLQAVEETLQVVSSRDVVIQYLASLITRDQGQATDGSKRVTVVSSLTLQSLTPPSASTNMSLFSWTQDLSRVSVATNLIANIK